MKSLPMIPVTFHRAVRIAVDAERRVEVAKVNLVFFGEPGNRRLKKSIAGSPWTSWYTSIDTNPSTVTLANLIQDPTHHNVYYILYKDEDAGEVSKASCLGLEVIDYIGEVVSARAKTVKPSRLYHLLEEYYIPGFVRLLRTPLEGYDRNGERDGDRAGDALLMMVQQEANFDPKSVGVFNSKRTSRLS